MLTNTIVVFKDIFESSPIGMAIVSTDGKFLAVNSKIAALLGYSEKKLSHLTLEEVIHQEDIGKLNFYLSNLIANKINTVSIKLRFIHKHGDSILVFLGISRAKNENGLTDFFILQIKDSTLETVSEEDLQNERLLLRTVIDNIPHSIYCKDTSGRKFLANLKELEYTGVNSEKELLGKTDFDFYPKEIAEKFTADDNIVIKTGKPVLNREEYFIDKNGQKKWLLTSKIPLRDTNGVIVGLVGIGHDITERILAKEKIAKRNKQLSKLNAEKDKFYSIIAHDLKNPAGSVSNFLELLICDYEEISEDEKKLYIKYSYDASKRLTELLLDLLNWGRISRGLIEIKRTKINLFNIVGKIKELFLPTALEKNITIDISNCEAEIYSDENMLNTVLRNFVSNAIKFTEKDGKIIISYSTNHKHHYISVQDTGVGIPKEKINDLFKIDKVTTTKGTAKEIGTGLGLPTANEFVKKCGGEILVKSKEGAGSEFIVKLPV